jgi:Domain of unknown function (DUF4145)
MLKAEVSRPHQLVSRSMQCPHCRVEFFEQATESHLGIDADGAWDVLRFQCPKCLRMILRLRVTATKNAPGKSQGDWREWRVYPRGSSRPLVPPEVPDVIAKHYVKACLILLDSPEAAAALARRSLQHILRDAAGVKPSDLVNEIQQVLDSGQLSKPVADALDGVRVIGNFAAHPIKSKTTGEIIDVEPGEVDWTLDTLEALFDFYFVQPALLKAKRDAVNKKLAEAGKPPLK